MKIDFYVKAVLECKNCGGTGVVLDHYWALYHEYGEGKDPALWFSENGFVMPKNEETDCPVCYGVGGIVSDFPLEEALKIITGEQNG